jgi:hypothetical protein
MGDSVSHLAIRCLCALYFGGCFRAVFSLVTPQASNQAVERTATRRALALCVATTSSLRSTRALGGRRSLWSR